MGLRASDEEKAIVTAFLRTGHPWMAFGTILIKSGFRILVAAAAIAAIQQGDGVPALLKLLHLSIYPPNALARPRKADQPSFS